MGPRQAVPKYPQVVSLSPTQGSGATVILGAVYQDAAGAANLGQTLLLVNNTPSGTNGCFVNFYPDSQQLFLAADDGNNWSGPVLLGENRTLENSSCQVFGGGSSLQLSGNQLTLRVNLAFKAAFAGQRYFYGYAYDRAGAGTGWFTGGSWTVTAPAAPSWNGYLDQADCSSVRGWAMDSTRPNTPVWVDLYDGSTYLTSLLAGQYRADLAGAGTYGNGYHAYSWATPASLKNGVPHSISVRIGGTSTVLFNSPRTLTCGTYSNRPPTSVSITGNPAGGGVARGTLTAVYEDLDGVADFAYTHMLISPSITGTGSCFTYYYEPANIVYLADDAGSFTLGAIALGSSGSIENSQCRLNGIGSIAGVSATRLTVNLDITFKPAFAGPKNLYAFAVDTQSANSGWLTGGTWTVPPGNRPPTNVSLTASPVGGGVQTGSFTAVFNEPDGPSDAAFAHLLINTIPYGDKACFIWYQGSSHQLRLNSDAAINTWLGPITPGAVTSLSNGNNILD